MKKLLTVLTILILLTNPVLAQTTPEVPGFRCQTRMSDVAENDNLCYYVNLLYYNGIISGYSDDTYRQNNPVTRAEFSKYIARTFRFHRDMSTEIEEGEFFPDVNEDNVFFDDIYSLRKDGIILGYSDGTFKPDEFVTRGQAAKFLANSLEKLWQKRILESTEVSFSDLAEENVFRTHILKLKKLSEGEHELDQITNVNSTGYRSDDFVTREELAKMVANTYMISGIERYSKLPQLSRLSDGMQYDERKVDGKTTLMEFEDMGIIVLKTTGDFEFMYNRTDLKSLTQVAEENDFKFAINGSYFGAFNRQRSLREVIEDPDLDYIIVEGVDTYLNVRSEPDVEEDNIVGRLDNGHTAEKTGENDEWFEIKYNEESAWVSKDYSRDANLDTDTKPFWEYLHAGFLNYYGEHMFPLKVPGEDSQVTHVVRYDTEGNDVDIYDHDEFKPSSSGEDRYVEFQTGPLLLRDSIFQNEFMDNSKNGNIRRPRNIIFTTDNGKTKYFIIAKDSYKYHELLHVALNLQPLRGKLYDGISLDGGSSIMIYSEKYPEYSYLSYKRLPLIIGFK